MSQWTHVAGCIRVDGLPGFGFDPDLSCLGRVVKYDDRDAWETGSDGLPMGSEGSLYYQIIEGEPGSFAAYAVAVWGDLRDYDSVDEIESWFKKVVIDSKLSIRDAVLVIHVDYQKRCILTITKPKEGPPELRRIDFDDGSS